MEQRYRFEVGEIWLFEDDPVLGPEKKIIAVDRDNGIVTLGESDEGYRNAKDSRH